MAKVKSIKDLQAMAQLTEVERDLIRASQAGGVITDRDKEAVKSALSKFNRIRATQAGGVITDRDLEAAKKK